MSGIYWSGRSTNGVFKRKFEADNFKDLFDILMEEEIINSPDYNVYDHAVLEKYDKTEDDQEFLDSDGDFDYEKVEEFVKRKPPLTDEELWLLISEQDGNAYYQNFKRWNEDTKEFVEISEKDFDKLCKYRY